MSARDWMDACLVLIALTDLRVLGGSRLLACISTVAVQGLLLGLLPILAHDGGALARSIEFSVLSILIKALLLPFLLRRALREAQVLREIQPIVSQNLSLVFGFGALAAGAWLASGLPLPPGVSTLGAPVAFCTVFTGLFLIIARRQALTQVIGYLIVENGIFTFGMLFVRGTPWLVEVGVMLDVLVGVFVMGIALFHINRAFDSLDSGRLALLHELTVVRAPLERDQP